jgi:hypothetical protein
LEKEHRKSAQQNVAQEIIGALIVALLIQASEMLSQQPDDCLEGQTLIRSHADSIIKRNNSVSLLAISLGFFDCRELLLFTAPEDAALE